MTLNGVVKAIGQLLSLFLCIAFFGMLAWWLFRAQSGEPLDQHHHQILLILLLLLGGPICHFFATRHDKFEVKLPKAVLTLGGGYAVSFAAVYFVTRIVAPLSLPNAHDPTRLVQFDFGAFAEHVSFFACEPDHTVMKVLDQAAMRSGDTAGPVRYICRFSSPGPITIQFTISRGHLSPKPFTIKVPNNGLWGEIIPLSEDIEMLVKGPTSPPSP